jgi:hypothetical protein
MCKGPTGLCMSATYDQSTVNIDSAGCYTFGVNFPRQLPLDDESGRHGVWNERMVPGEYAVHYSSFPAASHCGSYCTVLGSLDDAVAYAQQQVKERPALRCTIYDHEGLVGPPLRDIRGCEYKDKNSLSPRFRRWAGSILFFGGLILTVIDWRSDFELSWPAMIGTRIIVPGFGLLLMEAIVQFNARRGRKNAGGREMA